MAAVRVLLCGGEAAGVRALRSLLASELTPIGVAADPDSTLAAEGLKAELEVLDSAAPASADFASWIADYEIDVLVNAHSLRIVDQAVLAALPLGGFNLHPGPLPGYSGLNAPSWAIINGESKHAVTLHRMDAGIDTGSVVSTAWFDLDNRSTGLSASAQCARLGVGLLEELFDHLAANAELPTVATEGNRRLYRAAERPFDGRFPVEESAEVIDRVVRACAFHPLRSPIGTPQAAVNGQRFGVVAGTPVESSGLTAAFGSVVAAVESSVNVAVSDGFYRIDRIVVDDAVIDAGSLIKVGDQIL